MRLFVWCLLDDLTKGTGAGVFGWGCDTPGIPGVGQFMIDSRGIAACHVTNFGRVDDRFAACPPTTTPCGAEQIYAGDGVTRTLDLVVQGAGTSLTRAQLTDSKVTWLHDAIQRRRLG